MTERTLTTALAELGNAIDFPPTPDLDAAFGRLQAPGRRAGPQLRWVIAAAATAVLAMVVVVAPVREAIADWLGIGAVRIVEVEEIPLDLGSTVIGLGDQTTPVEALDLSSGVEPWPEALGEPDRVYVKIVDGALLEMSMVWRPSEDLPEVGTTGLGALLTRFTGRLEGPVTEKTVGPETTVETVTVDGAPGFWISGEAHSFGYFDVDGVIRFEDLRLAGNTLLWDRGGESFRFESGLERDEATEVAEMLGG